MPRFCFPLANELRCFEAIHYRHLAIHQNRVRAHPPHYGIDRFFTVPDDLKPDTQISENRLDEYLVD